uniref:Piwi 2 n=1 Tax=Fimbriaphyllia ancora TaxID=46750 RepID=A0A1B2INM3_FIMAN|nr:piwi 2 [Fimbriaphyllia ancora]
MAGRGGRGAALLQALEQPARPPGQAAQNGQNGQPSHQGPPQPGPAQHGQRQPYPHQYQQPQQFYQQPPQPYQQRQPYPYQQQPPQPYQQRPPYDYQQRSTHQQRQPHPYQQQPQYQPRQYPPPQQYQYQQMPAGRGQMYGRGGPMYGAPASDYGQRPSSPPPQQAPSYGRGAQMAAVYGRGAPAPATQTPYGQATTMGDVPQHPLSTGQPTVPLGGRHSPPQSQEQRPSPPQSQQRGSEVPTAQMARMKVSDDVPRTQTGEKGTAGKQTSLSANFIPIRFIERKIYQYHVSYSPDIDSRKARHGLLKAHSDLLGTASAFDGSILFLPKELEKPTTVLESEGTRDGSKVTLTVTLTRVVPPDDCLQLLNIIFRRVMKLLQLKQVGRYYYDPNRPASIPQHKIELWPGYITSIQCYEGGMMLLCDVSHRLLRTETVYEFLNELYQRKKERFEEETKRQLVGNIVLTRYNNKTYRIDDVAFDQNPRCTFTFHTGEEMSYMDYYRKVYNKELQDPEQPLLVHRPKDREIQRGKKPGLVCLIPELCYITGLTDAVRQDFRVMKDIAAHTRVSPMQRQQAMMKFIDNINSCPEALHELTSWGVQLDQTMLRTEGRQLPLEKIILGSSQFQSSPQADWGQQAVKEQVITPVPLRKWLVFFVNRDKSKAIDFINMMKKVTPAMGIQVLDPLPVEMPNDRTETYLRNIRENLTPEIQMVVIIFPTSRDDRYSAVKKLCCVESPVPSQVINAKTISQQNKLRSVTQKTALQINCKLGGELWALEIPLKSLMVIGIDVYHDASRGGRSVGGFVASMNKSLTRWYSRVCFQSPGQELIDGLKMALTSSLKKFHEVNHTLPDRIVVFRDGVGDGQLRTVAGYEVQQLSECFTLFGEAYHPKMAVVIVSKRINARIFAAQGNGPMPKLDNPGPGTILDHTITRKDWYDFYLVSQHVRQGTVTPTHYIVVHDKSELKPDYMQRLSYKLTHLYYNWPGTVRVPAPCQYAHKLAYLVGQNIHNEPSHDLSDRLFFL